MSKSKWLLEKLANIVFDIIAGYLLYLIVGGYISQPLSGLHPHLPTLLIVSLTFSIIVGFLYRFYKSVKFHRFIERTSGNLFDFLGNWDKLRGAFDEAVESREDEKIQDFGKVRTMLQYDYAANEVSSAVRVMRYGRVDRVRGIAVPNYDVIGNLLAESPFIKMREWLNVRFMYRDFTRDWDVGRTILVGSIGYFSKFRRSLTHRLYWLVHLVPFTETEEMESETPA